MRNLSVKITRGVLAPHKAIMLISIIDLIKEDKITSNAILPDELIAETFKKNWNRFADNKREFSIFKCSIWTPYWHMKNEPFWHFKTNNSTYNIDSLVPAGQTASIGAIRSHIQYAYLDNELFELLQDSVLREKLRELLIDTYISCAFTVSSTEVNDSSKCYCQRNTTQTEEITIIIDKKQKAQLLKLISSLDGVISIVNNKLLPFIFAITVSSKFSLEVLIAA